MSRPGARGLTYPAADEPVTRELLTRMVALVFSMQGAGLVIGPLVAIGQRPGVTPGPSIS